MLFALMMAREGSCVKILTLLRRKSCCHFNEQADSAPWQQFADYCAGFGWRWLRTEIGFIELPDFEEAQPDQSIIEEDFGKMSYGEGL